MILGSLAARGRRRHVRGPAVADPDRARRRGRLPRGRRAGLLPGWWQVRFEVPLLITTLLLNYIAALFAAYLVTYPLRDLAAGGLAETKMIPESIQLPWLFGEPRLHIGLFVALLLPLGVWWFQRRTVLGYVMRMTGFNPRFARVRRREHAAGRSSRRCSSAARSAASPASSSSWASITATSTARSRSAGYAWSGFTAALLALANPLYTVDRRRVPGRARRGCGRAWSAGPSVPLQLVDVVQGVDHPDDRGPGRDRDRAAACPARPAGGRLMDDILAIFDVALLISTVRLVSPILLAALGGMFTERAGIFNIALEGLMLIGSFFAIAGVVWTGNPYARRAGRRRRGDAHRVLPGRRRDRPEGQRDRRRARREHLCAGVHDVPDAAGLRRVGRQLLRPEPQGPAEHRHPVRRRPAGHRAARVGLLDPGLPRGPAGAAVLRAAVPSPARACGSAPWARIPIAAGSIGINVRRTKYLAVAVVGRAVRARRRAAVDLARDAVRAGHDRRPRLHRARRRDVRPGASGRACCWAACSSGSPTR